MKNQFKVYVMFFIVTVLFFLLFKIYSPQITGYAIADQLTATRNLPDSITEGDSFSGEIAIDVVEGNEPEVFGIEENIPSGWQIDSASHSGTIRENSIEWVFANGIPGIPSVEDSVITYTLTSKSTSNSFDGEVITSDESMDIGGDTSLIVNEVTEETGGSGGSGGSGGGGSSIACISDWKCFIWTKCVGGKQTRTCVDQKSCVRPTAPKPEEQRECIAGEDWGCTEWSPKICPSGMTQSRTCTDKNNAGTELAKPPLTRKCEYEPNCFDGVRNQNEEDIDCGGKCKSCAIAQNPSDVQEGSKLWWILIIILLIGGGVSGGFIVYAHHVGGTHLKNPEKEMLKSRQKEIKSRIHKLK